MVYGLLHFLVGSSFFINEISPVLGCSKHTVEWQIQTYKYMGFQPMLTLISWMWHWIAS